MSWRCDLTGKKPLVGHKVSHSNVKTKRRFMPNLRNVTLISDALGRSVRVRVSANALRDRGPSRRARCLPAQGQGRRTGAQDARSQARQIAKKQAKAAPEPAAAG